MKIPLTTCAALKKWPDNLKPFVETPAARELRLRTQRLIGEHKARVLQFQLGVSG